MILHASPCNEYATETGNVASCSRVQLVTQQVSPRAKRGRKLPGNGARMSCRKILSSSSSSSSPLAKSLRVSPQRYLTLSFSSRLSSKRVLFATFSFCAFIFTEPREERIYFTRSHNVHSNLEIRSLVKNSYSHYCERLNACVVRRNDGLIIWRIYRYWYHFGFEMQKRWFPIGPRSNNTAEAGYYATIAVSELATENLDFRNVKMTLISSAFSRQRSRL